MIWKRIRLYFSIFIVTFGISYLSAVFVDFDYLTYFWTILWLVALSDAALICALCFALRLDATVFAFAGFHELIRLAAIDLFIFVFHVILRFLPNGREFMRWRWIGLDAILLGAALAALFLSVRLFRQFREYRLRRRKKDQPLRAIVVGAGDAGRMIVREMMLSDYVHARPVCILDDDPAKCGTVIYGVKVRAGIPDVALQAKKCRADEIILALPSVSHERMREIVRICTATGLKILTVPGVAELVGEGRALPTLREVDINDLLGREPIRVDNAAISDTVKGKTVLVTGGGGSIGSELCRQIASFEPKLLIIFDIYENNAYEIEQELRRSRPELNLLVLIGSVRDEKKIDDLFSRYRPDIVFNAAAHKHVPLMETSPNEAIKNNVFGTLNVAMAADRWRVSRFVQISTDKAVNPTNVMGASKRICEMIIQSIGRHSEHTEFVAVRFGNVLGSNGSVIPLFRKQIKEGGPVTVTHKDIIRYFMTIPEAVSLVLQACCYASSGDIFVFDMGKPVRIYDLAENLIRLSGLRPGIDIKIVCTGLRPGEKLYEERLMAEEGMQKTQNELISIGKPIEFDESYFWSELQVLRDLCKKESQDIRSEIMRIVPTYHEPEV